jgi:hypothetical protein
MPITFKKQTSSQTSYDAFSQYSLQDFFTFLPHASSSPSNHARSSSPSPEARFSAQVTGTGDRLTNYNDINTSQTSASSNSYSHPIEGDSFDDDILGDDQEEYSALQTVGSHNLQGSISSNLLRIDIPGDRMMVEEEEVADADDDGIMLARLMKRAEGLRDGVPEEPQPRAVEPQGQVSVGKITPSPHLSTSLPKTTYTQEERK